MTVDTQLLTTVRSLVTEGLKAGGFLKGQSAWEDYYGGQRLLLRERQVGVEHEGSVVVADVLDSPLLMSVALNDIRNHVIVGRELAPDVDLSKIRAERLRYTAKMGENYWAVYVVDEGMLVSLGAPFSSSRLIGEILHAQTGHAFEQRRVCAQCGSLNAYRARYCRRCNERLAVTGRLNRWMHYDNEETAVRDLTPEEEKKLANSIKAKISTLIHPWKADTVKRKLPDELKRQPANPEPARSTSRLPAEPQDVHSLLSAPTMPIKRSQTKSNQRRSTASKPSRAEDVLLDDEETIPPGQVKAPVNRSEKNDSSPSSE